jgi:hypothetical protein
VEHFGLDSFYLRTRSAFIMPVNMSIEPPLPLLVMASLSPTELPLPSLLLCPDKPIHEHEPPPPTYSPSVTAPPYSPSPGPLEQMLAATARSGRSRPTGILVRSNKLINIALRGQEEDAAVPTYGRNNTVIGDIGLSCTQGVHSVSIEVS